MPASPRRLTLLVAGVLAGGALVPITAQIATATPDAGPTCSQSTVAGPVTCTFAFTGATQDWTVPQGATSVTITAVGGHGSDTGQGLSAIGGRGGVTVGTYVVDPGDVLTVTVAGDGSGPAGGFGYGHGGASNRSDIGAGGGGGSAVASSTDGLLVVAGGGGGAGLRSRCTIGGTGGDAGQDGQPGGPCNGVSGGVGGAAGGSSTTDGTSTWPGPDGGGGGAGGGGYLGGLAGQGVFSAPGPDFTGAGGGGGGTSYAAPAGTEVSTTGLSSHVGNGLVEISYQPGGAATGLDLSPVSSTAHTGEGVTYTAATVNSDGFTIADVSEEATFTISPDGSCTGATCTPTGPHVHTVTAHVGTAPDDLTATATLDVTEVPSFTSPADAFFVVGDEGSFTVTATGVPTPGITVKTGSLPSGLSLVDHGDGTATLSGTPVAPRGTTDLTLQASSSEGQVTQTLHVHVQSVPTFFGPDTLTYVVGQQGSDQVLTDATPDATLSVTDGTVPAGLTFTDNGDGTATLAGTATGPAGPTVLTVSATNAAGSVTHDYLVRVASVPELTSPDHVTLRAGRAASFQIVASGYPSPDIRLNGSTLPSGLQLVQQGNGTATIEGTPSRAASVTVMLQAENVAGAVDQNLALTISPRPGPCANPQRGTSGDDRLVGTDAGDRLRGQHGNDVLLGRGGADCLGGGRGADVLRGDGGPDLLSGRGGPDVLVGGPGPDKVRGGPGDDVIRVRDGRRDLVWCGPGHDRVIADPQDVTVGCEQVIRARRR